MSAGNRASSSSRRYKHSDAGENMQGSGRAKITYPICGKLVTVMPVIPELTEVHVDDIISEFTHNAWRLPPMGRNSGEFGYKTSPTTSSSLTFTKKLKRASIIDITRSSSSRKIPASCIKYNPGAYVPSNLSNAQRIEEFRNSTMKLEPSSIQQARQECIPCTSNNSNTRHNVHFSSSKRYPDDNSSNSQSMRSAKNVHQPVSNFESLKRTVESVTSIVNKGRNFPMDLDVDYDAVRTLKTASNRINEASKSKNEFAGISGSTNRDSLKHDFVDACKILKLHYPCYFAYLKCLYGISGDKTTFTNFENMVTERTAVEIIRASKRPSYILRALEDTYGRLRRYHK